MASHECWVRLWGTIKSTMADKTLSTPQRSEEPFHACPEAGRAAGSWWPAGSLALVQPNAISAPCSLWAAGCMETPGCKICVTHVSMYTHTHTWQHLFLVLTRLVLDYIDAAASSARERKKEQMFKSVFIYFYLAFFLSILLSHLWTHIDTQQANKWRCHFHIHPEYEVN